MTIRRRTLGLASATLALAPFLAGAQAWPAKPVRIVIPYPPGGPTDAIGRIMAQEMARILGQPLVVENKSGGGGTIGTGEVARSAADGYTLLMNPSIHVTYTGLYKRLTFDPMSDFEPIGLLGVVPMVAVVPASTAHRTLRDLIDAARARPGTVSFASPGQGSLPHLAGELLSGMEGLRMMHVAYKGSAPALTDLVGGHVNMMFAPLVSCPENMWHKSCMPMRYLGNGDTAMRAGRPKAELVLSDEERSQLQSYARSRSLPAALSSRARIVLSSADGEANSSIAERLKLTKATVGKWRSRFIERRLAGLYDDVRPGKPRTIDDERVAQLIKTTLHTKPADGSTRWSVRSAAAETGISKTSVQRYFQLFGLQPHRTEGFKLSNDPFFIEKLRDVVGLYLSPPDNALVICVDEKSQCQALERTQPMLPMGFGYAEGVTHDYKRHGTTTLFAALNVLNGAVLATCKPRHRHQEFLSFLREIDKAVPAELDIHCIADNYATHSHPKIKAWLSARPRWHMHFIPTYSSWLNQVERFFSLITDKAIRRGSFTSVKQLVQRIDHFVAAYNTKCQPFKWTATADSILEKLHRLCSRITGTGH